jgi:hypothetical protein
MGIGEQYELEKTGMIEEPKQSPNWNELGPEMLAMLKSTHLFLMAIRPEEADRALDRQIGKEMQKIRDVLTRAEGG